MILGFEPTLVVCSLIGFLGLLLAGIGLVCHSRHKDFPVWGHWFFSIVSLLGLIGSLVGLILQQPLGFWLSPVLLAGAYFLLFVLPSTTLARFARSLQTWAHYRRLRFAMLAGLLALFPVTGFLVAYHSYDDEIAATSPDWNGILVDHEADYQPLTPTPVSTDRGQAVQVMRKIKSQSPHIDPEKLARQSELLEMMHLKGHVIQVSTGWQHSNCHGWTFTDGRFWVVSSEVDTILDHNGYQPQSTPRQNDLAIYRSPTTGEVTHSGIVRYVSDSLILVESKWGRLGRFVHPHNVHCYQNNPCTFYRSSRPGHLLQGLPSDSLPGLNLPGSIAVQ